MNKINLVAEMQERIEDLKKRRTSEQAVTKRIADNISSYYSERQKVGIGAPLRSLLEKAKLNVEDLEQFYAHEEKEAERTITELTPRLQLRKEEIALMQEKVRGVILINPCSAFHSSPAWVCQPLATSCSCDPPALVGNASASGQCATPSSHNNRCDPMVKATGTGSKGFSSAEINCELVFDIPARNSPQTVWNDVWVDLHGFYILRPSAGMSGSTFSLDLEAQGFQYGYSWASDHKSINLSGNATGRVDKSERLGFNMPIGGGDPYQVVVTVKLKATAFAGGALAVGDFQSGAGNYINVVWVNTLGTIS